MPYSIKIYKKKTQAVKNHYYQSSVCAKVLKRDKDSARPDMAGRVGTATVRAVKRRLVPARAALTLTQPAVQRYRLDLFSQLYQRKLVWPLTVDILCSRIKTLTAAQPGALGLRIGVRTRGCNGEENIYNNILSLSHRTAVSQFTIL